MTAESMGNRVYFFGTPEAIPSGLSINKIEIHAPKTGIGSGYHSGSGNLMGNNEDMMGLQ